MHRYVFPNALQNYLFSRTYLLPYWHIFFGLYHFWHEPSVYFLFVTFILLFLLFLPLFSRYWFNPRRIRRVSLIPYTWLFCSRRWSAVSSFSPPVGFVLAATPRVFLCPFPRMLFGDPRIVFIVIPSFLCNSVQFSGHPTPPSAQCVVLGAIVVESSC